MLQKGRSVEKLHQQRQPSLAEGIEAALVSLLDAELNLRNLRTDRRTLAFASLATAAATVESLKAALAGLERGTWVAAELRHRMWQVHCAVGRVGILYAAAKEFHSGLNRARQGETAVYDASGGSRHLPEPPARSRTLEARG